MNVFGGSLALWAVTPGGAALARRIAALRPGVRLKWPRRRAELSGGAPIDFFDALAPAIAAQFAAFDGHIFIMATGIVVRLIAPHLKGKSRDPAVVVLDEKGCFAISLLSGHLGGANQLAAEIGGLIGAAPVITTATDLNGVPAIDLLAQEQGLVIENPGLIKRINLAFLENRPLSLYDPWQVLDGLSPEVQRTADAAQADIVIDDRLLDVSDLQLVLRPRTLIAGIGCNRGADMAEIEELLLRVLAESRLSVASLAAIATIDLKADEAGVSALAGIVHCPVHYFSKSQLNQVAGLCAKSRTVMQHVGVYSVCEAAAILAAQMGPLIVSKQKTRNVTVALARRAFMSSVSAPASRSTSPPGP